MVTHFCDTIGQGVQGPDNLHQASIGAKNGLGHEGWIRKVSRGYQEFVRAIVCDALDSNAVDRG
jgi:hypothetical protein